MKIVIGFKTPDAVDDALKDVSEEGHLAEEDFDEIKKKLSKWIKWGEFVRLVYDTETDTISVI
jgi:hypothetical protein